MKLFQCVEYGPSGTIGPNIKCPMGPNLSWTYLGTYWADFHDSKAIWNYQVPRCAPARSFSPRGPRGLQRAHGFQIFSGICYMSTNTGIIFAFIIYRDHMVPFNTRSHFTPTPDKYVDSFVNLIIQWSLLGRQTCYLLCILSFTQTWSYSV